MKLRFGLAAATCLALPVLAHAQPVTGPYVSLGGGTSIMYPPNVTFEPQATSGNYQFRPDYAGVAGIGYGLGDGFRVELGGIYARNTLHATNLNGVGHFGSTGAEKKYGGLVNVYYDIPVGLPIFPYVGAGAGYEYVKYNNNLTIGGLGNGSVIKTGGTEGSFAYNIIAGVAYPIAAVPGLSVTAEYRFQQLTESRSYSSYQLLGAAQTQLGKTKVGQESEHTFLIGLRYQIFNPPPPAPPPAPVVPVAAPAPAPAKTYLVFFDWDKYNLTPRALSIISQAAADSKTAQTTTIDVSGYTDTSGTPTYNQGLSERRAKAVAAQLVADGVSASEIETHAFGETHLLVPTGPGVREPQNRRVEIVLQ